MLALVPSIRSITDTGIASVIGITIPTPVTFGYPWSSCIIQHTYIHNIHVLWLVQEGITVTCIDVYTTAGVYTNTFCYIIINLPEIESVVREGATDVHGPPTRTANSRGTFIARYMAVRT